jgi:hypothetical protein
VVAQRSEAADYTAAQCHFVSIAQLLGDDLSMLGMRSRVASPKGNLVP